MPLETVHQLSASTPASTGPFLTEDAPGAYASKIALHKKPFLDFLNSFEWKYPASDPQQQFLDIGCGTGDITREHILPRCPPCRRIVATDFSTKMLEYARQNFPHPKIEYKHLDIGMEVEQFLAEHGTFQRVYSLRTLHWVKDQAKAFANISRLMSSGGECLMLFLGRCDVFDFIRRMAKMEPWTKYSDVSEGAVPKTHDVTDAAELKSYVENLVHSAGLTLVTLDIWQRESSFLDTEKAVEIFLMSNPVLPILPEEEKEAFIADARKHVPAWRCAYHENNPLPFASFVVHAFKP
uniref:Putative juvenile hormone acid methyltransferase n=1 Tax=Amblyomma triste TaxID=251400 RepID=A0A023G764_AMBTT